MVKVVVLDMHLREFNYAVRLYGAKTSVGTSCTYRTTALRNSNHRKKLKKISSAKTFLFFFKVLARDCSWRFS